MQLVFMHKQFNNLKRNKKTNLVRSRLNCIDKKYFSKQNKICWNAIQCFIVLVCDCLAYYLRLFCLHQYTGCPRRNVQYFGRVFLMLKYTDITQNTYIQSWTVMEIMAREVWNFDSCYTLIDYQIRIKTGRNMWFM